MLRYTMNLKYICSVCRWPRERERDLLQILFMNFRFPKLPSLIFSIYSWQKNNYLSLSHPRGQRSPLSLSSTTTITTIKPPTSSIKKKKNLLFCPPIFFHSSGNSKSKGVDLSAKFQQDVRWRHHLRLHPALSPASKGHRRRPVASLEKGEIVQLWEEACQGTDCRYWRRWWWFRSWFPRVWVPVWWRGGIWCKALVFPLEASWIKRYNFFFYLFIFWLF